MQVLAATRALSVALLSGTFVGLVPQVESPVGNNAARFPQGAVCELVSANPRIDLASAADQPTKPSLQLAAAVQAEEPPKKKDYVKAKVFLSVDKLPAGGKCQFAVILDVLEGWHINANPPSPENMIATQVTVQGKHKSKQLATKYPEGNSLEMEELDEPVSVYEGEVVIRGEIQAPADSAGKNEELEFQIKYQACNEKTCLPPKTLKLTGKIDIVKAGTAVKPINQKYFTEKK